MANPTSGMEGKIQEYWGYVYSNNQAGIGQLISADVTANYELIVDGKKLPPVEIKGSTALIEAVGKVSSVITNVLKNSLEYHTTSDPNVMEVDYEQKLVANNDGTLMEMYSKGKQIWTYNGTVFTALKVMETDSFKKPYVNPAAAPVQARTCVLL